MERRGPLESRYGVPRGLAWTPWTLRRGAVLSNVDAFHQLLHHASQGFRIFRATHEDPIGVGTPIGSEQNPVEASRTRGRPAAPHAPLHSSITTHRKFNAPLYSVNPPAAAQIQRLKLARNSLIRAPPLSTNPLPALDTFRAFHEREFRVATIR